MDEQEIIQIVQDAGYTVEAINQLSNGQLFLSITKNGQQSLFAVPLSINSEEMLQSFQWIEAKQLAHQH